jgi:hypothetical protein
VRPHTWMPPLPTVPRQPSWAASCSDRAEATVGDGLSSDRAEAAVWDGLIFRQSRGSRRGAVRALHLVSADAGSACRSWVARLGQRAAPCAGTRTRAHRTPDDCPTRPRRAKEVNGARLVRDIREMGKGPSWNSRRRNGLAAVLRRPHYSFRAAPGKPTAQPGFPDISRDSEGSIVELSWKQRLATVLPRAGTTCPGNRRGALPRELECRTQGRATGERRRQDRVPTLVRRLRRAERGSAPRRVPLHNGSSGHESAPGVKSAGARPAALGMKRPRLGMKRKAPHAAGLFG